MDGGFKAAVDMEMCIRDSNSAEAHKNWLGEVTNPRQIKGGLKEAIEGADVFLSLIHI